MLLGLLTTVPGGAQASPAAAPDAGPDPNRRYLDARERYLQNTNDVARACELARSTFTLGDVVETKQRERLAIEGVAACRQALLLDQKSAPAHLYLALNLGQLARSRPFSALRMVGEMEQAFRRARELDEHLSHAGPDRGLGLLYREAPGWPASIGNRAKARRHLLRAVALAPEFPENRLNLAESGVQWSDAKLALPEIAELRELLPKARRQFVGPEWASDWRDWDQRWTNLLRQAEREFGKEYRDRIGGGSSR